MDFFNSLVEVKKNSKNFEKWEAHHKDEEAQREELSKRRQHTEERKQAAKAYGEKIIDIVDIMDNHSESVAENVETTLSPLSGLAVLGTFFGGGFLVAKKVIDPAGKKIWAIKEAVESNEANRELANKIQETNKAAGKKGRAQWFSSWDLLSKKRIQKIADADLKKQAMAVYNDAQKQMKPHVRKIKVAGIGLGISTIASFIAGVLLQTKLQTDSSKVARYQARQELKDEKNFVMYTPEQIAAAKEELKQHPELLKNKKKSNLKQGWFKSIYNVIKDTNAYKKDKKMRGDESQKVTRQLTQEELIAAEKDKEVIQRTVRIINNEAEKNSENMEVAANVIFASTPVLGATVGAGISFILNKFRVLEKIVDQSVKKFGSEEAKEAFEEFKKVKKDDAGYHRKWKSFVEKLWDDSSRLAEETTDGIKNTKGKASLAKTPFKEMYGKGLATVFSHKWGRAGAISVIGGAITGFAGLILSLKLQKSSARAGRFTAKRELEQNPENFIGYTQQDYEEVKDVKSKKKETNKIKEYAMFIPNVLKQYYAYEKFRKTEYKEKQALNEILKKQEVTDEQLRDAKNLQRKIFNTFEKVDDNSQVYSESMEAACEIAQPFVWYGGIAMAAAPIVYGATQAYKHPGKWMNKIANKLSSASNIMQKKWFKKYLENVAKNIPNRVQSQKVDNKVLASLFNGINLQNDPAIEIFGRLSSNVANMADELRKMDNYSQYKIFADAKEHLNSFAGENIPKEFKKPLLEVLDELAVYGRYGGNTEYNMVEYRADILDTILNPEKLNKLPLDRQQKLEDFYESLSLDTQKFLAEMSDTLDFCKGLQNINSAQAVKAREQIIRMLSQNLPTDAHGNCEIPLSMLRMMEKLRGEKYNLGTMPVHDNKIVVPAGDVELLLNDFVTSVTTRKISGFIPKSLKNPQDVIQSLTTRIEKMTDEEYLEFAEQFRIPEDMTKKLMLETLPKVKKIFENIPKEESQKILNALITEFNNNPDEFVKLIQSGKIKQLFITPNLQKALTAAGISWTVFSFVLTYAVEAWMADMQLKAGRLGVMKAMESLDDNAYYANVEPTETTFTSAPSPSEAITQNKSLLDKFKQ